MARPSSKDQARRMLAILNILQENAHVPVEQLASLLELTPQATERMVEKLACVGIDDFLLMPLYVEDGQVYITDDLPAMRAPLRLSPAEARALLAALKRADIADDDPLAEKLVAAAAAPTFDRDELRNLRDQNEKSGIGDDLKKAALAIEERLLSRITYQKRDEDELQVRIIEPLQLFLEGEAWYLLAWCREAGALRTFRVDRIRELRVSKRRFEPREFDPEWRAMPTENLPLARIRLEGTVDVRALGWPGARIVKQESDGATIVEVPFARDSWIATQVVALLGKAVVLEPASLRDAVASRAAALLNQL